MLETSLIENPGRVLLLTACLALGCTTIHAPDDGGERDGGSCSCVGRECGDDGCGATCGSCSAGETCVDGVCGDCPRSCTGRECGDDGCDGSCGTCPIGQVCTTAGQCEGCTPSCAGRECGVDSCGTGSCGTCPAGESCSESGTCEAICVPNCAGRECGSNGCPTGSCGTCGAGDVCNAAGQCVCAAPVTCYRDYDGDGYANMRTTCSMSQCECPAGYIEARPDGAWDCNDTLPEIHPGADYGPPSPCVSRDAFCGSGLSTICSEPVRDLNCDGVVQRESTAIGGGCGIIGGVCRVIGGGAGWRTSVPDCGAEADWFLGTCTSTCSPLYLLGREQECR